MIELGLIIKRLGIDSLSVNSYQNDNAIDYHKVVKPILEDGVSLQWILLINDEVVLSKGITVPNAENLVDTIVEHGGNSPIAAIKKFLRNNPYIISARWELLKARRGPTLIRYERYLNSRNSENNEELDSKIWGNLPEELNELLNDPMAGFLVDLEAILPPGCPERVSPRMKLVYRRQQSNLIARIGRYPESAIAWRNLLRMDRALNQEHALNILSSGLFFPPQSNNISTLPYVAISRSIFKEASESGKWDAAVHSLRTIWEQVARPKLQYFDKGWVSSKLQAPSPDNNSRISTMEREEAWDALVGPLVEALIRSGRESQVPEMLMQLDDSWFLIQLDKKLMTIADKVGRPFLAKSWISCIFSIPVKIPREGMIGAEMLLLYQPAEGPLLGRSMPFQRQFQKRGISVNFMEVTTFWKNRLAWGDSFPKWGIVDWEGRALLQSESCMNIDEIDAKLNQLGVVTGLEVVDRFLKKNPRNLTAMVYKGAKLSLIRRASEIEDQNAMNNKLQNRERWRYYADIISIMNQLTSDPIGFLPDFLQRYPAIMPSAQDALNLPNRYEINELATNCTHQLEKILIGWPNNMAFWNAWILFSSYLSRPNADFLATVTPTPPYDASNWPPIKVVEFVGQDLKRQARWQDLMELLLPRLVGRVERLAAGATKPNLTWNQGGLPNHSMELDDLYWGARLALGWEP